MKLYVEYDEDYYTIEEGIKGINVDFKRLSRTEGSSCHSYKSSVPDPDFEEDDLPETATIVVSRYADGGTFGRTEGYWEVEGVFRSYRTAHEWKEANAKIIAAKHEHYFGGLLDIELHTIPVI